MPNHRHDSESADTSNWQQAQQQKEAILSALKLIESETFFEIDYGALSANGSVASSKSTVEETNSSIPRIENESLLNVEPIQPSYTDPSINLATTKQATQALMTLTFENQSLNKEIEQATFSPSIESKAHSFFQIDTVATSEIQFFYPAYTEASENPLSAPVLEQQFDEDWSATSGWGEIDVFSALQMATDKPLCADVTTSGVPSYLSALGFDKAWANGYTGQGVVIADIDTGIDLQNQTLMNGIHLNAYSWNFLNNSANIQDDNGHGTITAAELAMNGEGGAYGAELMVLKAMNASGQGSTHTIGQAIQYAVDHGASVINLSLSTHSENADIQKAMQYAYDHGVVVVAAAGNDATAGVEYPAAYAKQFSNVIAVGASQNGATHDVLASFSNTAGSESVYNFVDAIGTGIKGFTLDGNTATWSGTSMAAPLVAAEVAILKSANPNLSATQLVQNILHSTNSLDDMLSHVSQVSQTTVGSNTNSNTAAIASTSSYDYDFGAADYLQASTAYVPTEQHY